MHTFFNINKVKWTKFRNTLISFGLISRTPKKNKTKQNKTKNKKNKKRRRLRGA